jgi:hypothetical protein
VKGDEDEREALARRKTGKPREGKVRGRQDIRVKQLYE